MGPQSTGKGTCPTLAEERRRRITGTDLPGFALFCSIRLAKKVATRVSHDVGMPSGKQQWPTLRGQEKKVPLTDCSFFNYLKSSRMN